MLGRNGTNDSWEQSGITTLQPEGDMKTKFFAIHPMAFGTFWNTTYVHHTVVLEAKSGVHESLYDD